MADAQIPDKPALEGLEAKWSERWDAEGTYLFDRLRAAEVGRAGIYSIDTPPPTASGSLHIGHVFSYTHTDVKVRYGGRFVQSIDGLEGGGAGGSVDWFYFVNGFESDVGAAEYSLSPGDVVLTGTPAGVGYRRDPKVLLEDGDRIVVEISGVGRLENTVAAE